MLLNRLKTEFELFSKLQTNSQKLLISYTFFYIAYPILVIFVNAYLWRHSNSLYLVGLYNLCLAIGLSIGFYINGFLLNKTKINYLYLLGCILQGVMVFILMLFSVINKETIFIFGILSGIGSAFYWSNRHFLTLSNTSHEQRFYFNNLEHSLYTITSVILPFIVGWFIIFGENLNLYSTNIAYILVSVMALLSLLMAGLVIKDIKVDVNKITSIFLRNESFKWNLLRLVTFFMGISDGIILFIPTLLILILLGKENTLGTIQSCIAILSAAIMYYIGRKVGIKNRFNVIFAGIIILIGGTLIFGIYYSSLAAIIYVSASTLAIPLTWTPYQNLNFETIENEEKIHHYHKYSYLFDQELFLSFGRICGIIFFLLFIYFANQQIALQFTPFVVAIVQIPMLFIFKKIESL